MGNPERSNRSWPQLWARFSLTFSCSDQFLRPQPFCFGQNIHGPTSCNLPWHVTLQWFWGTTVQAYHPHHPHYPPLYNVEPRGTYIPSL